MKTDIVVSCPECGRENTVSTELQKEIPGIASFLAMLGPDIKQYSFDGHKKCACGKLVSATLTVTAGDEK